MRIFFFLFILIMLQQVAVHAQSSLNFSVGNSLPLGSQLLASEYTSTGSGTTTTTNQKGVYGTFGTGWNFSVSYAHSFSRNFGLDIAASYFSGSTITSLYSFSATGFSSVEEDHGSISGWLISPSLVLKSEPVKNIQPYAKFGFVLASVSFNTEQNITDKATGGGTTVTNTTNRVREYTGGLPFGLKGGLGVIFKPEKKTSFFAEIMFTSMAYFPSKASLTSYKLNGVENLSTLTESAKTTVFKREITSSTLPDPTKPTESLSNSLPMGNVLLNIGVSVKIGKANP